MGPMMFGAISMGPQQFGADSMGLHVFEAMSSEAKTKKAQYYRGPDEQWGPTSSEPMELQQLPVPIFGVIKKGSPSQHNFA